MATHDIDHAYEWADEVVLMHEGKVLRQGTPYEVCTDREALEKASLELPAVVRIYERLKEKGMLPEDNPASGQYGDFDRSPVIRNKIKRRQGEC